MVTQEQGITKEQEIEYYQGLLEKFFPCTPFNINAHLKLGKLYAELGRKAHAVEEFSFVAAHYIRVGAVVKAIAVNKMIVELDPQRKDALEQSSRIYFQQAELPDAASSFPDPIVQPPCEDEAFEEFDASSETFIPQSDADDGESFPLFEERLPKDELAQKLAEIPLFSHLEDGERRKIAEFLSPVEVKKGDAVIREGDSGDCMYLIRSGEVGIYTALQPLNTSAEKPQIQEQVHLASLREGDFFGEQALITNEPRNATVLALSDVRLLRFSKPDLDVILRYYGRIGQVMLTHHQQRVSNALECLHAAFRQKRGE